MYIFEANNIVKQFAKHVALNDVSIKVPKGQVFGLLGPNGAGKTTLIRIINQITAPDSGEVIFDGERLRAEHVRQIGYLPEERGLYKKMKVGEQSLYLAQLKGLNKKEAEAKLKEWFDKLEIQAWWDKKIEELSKGMQQKVQFVTTILHNPKLLIFDEPFSGFDPINANILKREILALKENGATIIFSTHNMASVEEVCDHIALINNSKKILDGPVNEVKEKYKSNVYEIKYRGAFNKLESTLSSNYEIIDVKEEGEYNNLKVKLLQGSTNELISRFSSFGNIIGFNEMIPSMNDIFIKVVEETNKQSKTESNE